MRVLSFIPTLLLATTSFVAAIPTFAPRTTDTSCTSSSGSSDVGVAQPIIDILVNATAEVKVLGGELSSCQTDSGSPDVSVVADIVTKVTAVVSYTVVQLEAEANVDLSGIDVTTLCTAIYDLFIEILIVLNTLVAILISLTGTVIGTLQDVVCKLLDAVTNLLDVKIFASASLQVILGAVISVICGVVKLLLNIVVHLEAVVNISK